MKKIKVYIATFTLFFSLYAIGVPCEPNVINLIGTFTVPGIDPSPSDRKAPFGLPAVEALG